MPWLALLLHLSEPGGLFCVEVVCSPLACVGSLRVFLPPSTVQRHLRPYIDLGSEWSFAVRPATMGRLVLALTLFLKDKVSDYR